MSQPMASVVIPVTPGDPSPGPCIRQVLRQSLTGTEVIVVCDPRVPREACQLADNDADLPHKPTRLVRHDKPSSPIILASVGFRAATGRVKVLLRPHCIPSGDGWLAALVRLLERQDVGAAVSRLVWHPAEKLPLSVRLVECAVPGPEASSADGVQEMETVSGLCDAYRASAVDNLPLSDAAPVPSVGQHVDISVRLADAGYSVVMSESALAERRVIPEEKRLRHAFRQAIQYGQADAILDRRYELRWLNAGVFGAAALSLLLVPIAAASVPIALIISGLIFAWGWFLGLRLPVLGWECPAAVLNFATFVALVLSIRSDWRPDLFGSAIHPAIIRQWCWIVAMVASYLAVLAKAGLTVAWRCARMPGGLPRAPLIFVLALFWWVLAGLGYLYGRFVAKARPERPAPPLQDRTCKQPRNLSA